MSDFKHLMLLGDVIMKKSGMNDVITLKSYIYLDEFEINSLYNQLYPDILQETITYEAKKNNNLNGSVNGAALGLIEAEGTVEHSSDTLYSSEIQTKKSIEYKANVIIKHICDNRLNSLFDIIKESCHSHSMLRGRIIAGYASFLLTTIYDSDDKLIELRSIRNNFEKKNTTFILESGDRKSIRDLKLEEGTDCYEDYFQSKEYGIEMHLGGNKIRREIRHLTRNIKEGKVFDFSVLGQISYAGANQYLVKPFAIW